MTRVERVAMVLHQNARIDSGNLTPAWENASPLVRTATLQMARNAIAAVDAADRAIEKEAKRDGG